jgi:ATP-dependent RNA helicase RhlE
MVLTPTRELAQQVEAEFVAFTRGMKLFSVSCVGGAPIMRQIKELELGVHAVIGTPGRVKDLIERGKIRMEFFDSIVLDEADRMLDMGFIDDMRFILGKMPKTKQGLFFSATFSPDIKRLCSDFLKDPVTVSVKTRDTASSVMQDVVRVSTDSEKIEALHEILIKPEYGKVLIFREMKRHVDGLAEELNKRGFKALALHGDMHNRERERAVKALETGKVQVVIATDVAARGLDISDISLVINYDIPNNYETYIHRIGRTGRAKKLGHALTFVPKSRASRY